MKVVMGVQMPSHFLVLFLPLSITQTWQWHSNYHNFLFSLEFHRYQFIYKLTWKKWLGGLCTQFPNSRLQNGHAQLFFLTLQTFIFHTTLFSYCPSIPFVSSLLNLTPLTPDPIILFTNQLSSSILSTCTYHLNTLALLNQPVLFSTSSFLTRTAFTHVCISK